MNANAKKWIEELRSGRYKQGKNTLCRGEGDEREFCCLGVACDLFIKENTKDNVSWKSYSNCKENAIVVNNVEMSYSFLPIEVQKWLLIREQSGSAFSGEIDSLVALNDEGKSFEEIADILEKNEEEYFFKSE